MSATSQQTALHDLVASGEPLTIEQHSGKSGAGAAEVLAMAEQQLLDSGVADTAYFGPETEFYVFDHVSFDQKTHAA